MITVVELNDTEARDFVEFQRHRKFFDILKDHGVFDLRSGEVRIHFSRLGEVVALEKLQHFTTNILP